MNSLQFEQLRYYSNSSSNSIRNQEINKYKYRIPLFGPNYSNSWIVRIIRPNTDHDLRYLWDGDIVMGPGAPDGFWDDCLNITQLLGTLVSLSHTGWWEFNADQFNNLTLACSREWSHPCVDQIYLKRLRRCCIKKAACNHTVQWPHSLCLTVSLLYFMLKDHFN